MSSFASGQNLAVVLSDVHIGTNVRTNWYQASVHEGYLKKVLDDWVVPHAASIRELVLLGDLVDFWTYPPAERPPTMKDIIAANPNMLGPGGALARAVAALPNRVSLMQGNHDINLSAADVTELSSAVGGTIRFVDPIYTLQGNSGKKTVFTHGHTFTLFNAPDLITKFRTPVGHFVTRSIAYKQVTKLLQPGQTVADLSLWGQPNPSWSTIFTALSSGKNPVGMFLDMFAVDAEFSESAPVVLPDGQTTTIAEAKTAYASLLADWQSRFPLEEVVRAAMADYEGGPYLAWFAQWLALKQDAELVVMGHTHQPIGGLTASPVTYVNNGYQCAAVPDLNSRTAVFSFTVVDLDTATAAMYKVVPDGQGGYVIADFSPPSSPVVKPPLDDYSCYIRISNSLGQQLTRDPLAQPTHGRWVLEPPTTIANGESGWLWLQDELGGAGTLGNVSYNGDLRYDFACPFLYIADNVVGGPGSDFVARSGADAWLPKGKVPPKGHPLQAKFNLVAADVDASFSGVCGQNSFATSGIGLLPGATLKLNGATALQGCIQGNSGACVYSITLAEGSFMGGVYQYRITIDGQGPKGLGSGSMYLRFTDRSGDVYTKSFYSSSRHTLTLDYNSDGPVIWKVEWSNT